MLRRLFMPVAKKTSSARSLAPPFPQKGTLGSPARLQAPSQRLAVAANFLRDNALRAAFFRHRKNIDFDRPYANNDNPNYIIQVGNVFGFIISIENIF